jgi:hypothetical protein
VIFVKRDSRLIPKQVVEAAKKAQKVLEGLPANERANFIKKKSRIWTAFAPYLSKMSYGKCWYSESPEVHSFFDVDHYRPKLETRRSDKEIDQGYEWLAFSWENFRLSAQRSNRLSTDEETDETQGKSSWFPLMEGSPKACWSDRCVEDEMPVLLDPTKKKDVRLIEVKDNGRIGTSRFCLGSNNKNRVEISVKILGLDLPKLLEARRRVMRDIKDRAEDLLNIIVAAGPSDTVANTIQIQSMVDALKEKTHPREAYSAAARSQLRLMGLSELCLQPEEVDI